MSGRSLEPAQLPAEAWRDGHMMRAWRTHDFRAVFHLACRLGITPEIIAENTCLPLDLVLSVMKGNTTLNSLALAESVASGLSMPEEARKAVGLPLGTGRATAVAAPSAHATTQRAQAEITHTNPVGVRIATLRKKRGLTHELLAERAGVSSEVVRKLEQQARNSARLATLDSLAHALGVSTAELLGSHVTVGQPGRKRQDPPDYLPAEVVNRPDFAEACDKRDLGALFRIAVSEGFTPSHLARRCGTTISHVSDYIRRGRQAQSIEIFERVSDGLHIPGDMLRIGVREWEKTGPLGSSPTEAPNEDTPGDDFTAELIRLMDARGVGVRELARRTNYGPGYISHLRHGKKRASPEAARRFDAALTAEGHLVAALLAQRENSGPAATRLINHAEGFSDLDPIEHLRQEINIALGQGAMGETSLDDWERTAIRYARATRDRAPAVLLADMGRDLNELKLLFNQHRSASALHRLTRVTAQMSGLMCLIFCILDDHPSFRGWARTARIAGNEAGDPETLSWILAQEAHGHYYSGDMLEAVDVARHAYEVVKIPCTGAALAAALEARACAIMGRGQETRKALDRAEKVLSQLAGDVLVPSAFGYDEASFRFHEGNSYTHLRDVKSAFKAQERALELCRPDNYTDWAMTRLDRAQCLMYSGDMKDGLAYAAETMANLAEPQRQGIIALRGQEIIETLSDKEKNLPTAREFSELLMASAGITEAKS